MAKAKPEVSKTALQAIEDEIAALAVHQKAAMDAMIVRREFVRQQEEQRNAVELIRQAKERAYAEITEAQRLALKYDLEFEFQVSYGMGGTFNELKWDGSGDTKSRTAQWESSSSQC